MKFCVKNASMTAAVYFASTLLCMAQQIEHFSGIWTDKSDPKTCSIPLGSSPDEATIFSISPKAIEYYEISCLVRGMKQKPSAVELDLDCYKGAGARWFETMSIERLGANRIILHSTRQRPTAFSVISKLQLYKCVAATNLGQPLPPRPVSHWWHNNSKMSFDADGSSLEIKYEAPREGLRAVGVRRETMMFLGKRNGQSVEGTAYIFNPACGPLPYEVQGWFADGDSSLVLSGLLPLADARCNVVKTKPDTLRFERLSRSVHRDEMSVSFQKGDGGKGVDAFLRLGSSDELYLGLIGCRRSELDHEMQLKLQVSAKKVPTELKSLMSQEDSAMRRIAVCVNDTCEDKNWRYAESSSGDAFFTMLSIKSTDIPLRSLRVKISGESQRYEFQGDLPSVLTKICRAVP